MKAFMLRTSNEALVAAAVAALSLLSAVAAVTLAPHVRGLL
jgi:hypothetical protein